MILVAIGSNLPHPVYGAPLAVCEAAVEVLPDAACRVVSCSRWFRSSPVPASDQPDFINGVISVRTGLNPLALLKKLHEIEAAFGRRRSVPNAARILDLDLLVYDQVITSGESPPILPHPRLSERAFVLKPLLDVAPSWKHPVSGRLAEELAAALPEGQKCVPIDPE